MGADSNKPISQSEAADLFGGLNSFSPLVLAVSGGPDSTALLWLAARWRDSLEKPPILIAITIDHALRKESAAEARAVAKLAKTLNVEHRTLRWTGRKPKTGIQEAARNARYDLLSKAADKVGARHILTAHTLDDQAETILFRLARGSGLSGLRGMAPLSSLPGDRREAPKKTRQSIRKEQLFGKRMDARVKPAHDGLQLVRPLLSIAKSCLLATLSAAKIPFADDPSNRDPRFTRPRLRELMPVLAAEGLDAERFATLARRIARADAAIERAVDDAMARAARRGTTIVLGAGHADLPPEIALRVLHRAIEQVGHEGPVELGKLEALYEALAAAGDGAARFRRTLAGAMITLSGEKLTVERAPPRRTAAKSGHSRPKVAFTKSR